MRMQDRMPKMRGAVKLTITDSATGKILEVRHANLIMTAFRELMVDIMDGTTTEVPAEIAVGDQVSPSTPTISDTVLDSELDRKAISTKTQPATTQAEYQAVFASTEAVGTLTETGLFTLASGTNTLLARVTFAGVVKASGTTLTVTWDVFF